MLLKAHVFLWDIPYLFSVCGVSGNDFSEQRGTVQLWVKRAAGQKHRDTGLKVSCPMHFDAACCEWYQVAVGVWKGLGVAE